MAEFISKSMVTKPKTEYSSKTCKLCNNAKQVTEFIPNKDWTAERRRDAWCRACVKKIVTKSGLKEYFWYNQREWPEDLWLTTMRKAQKELINNSAYKRSSKETQEKLIERLTCQNMIPIPSTYYKFEPHLNSNGEQLPYEEEPVTDNNEEESMIYSKDFNGKFTKEDLEYLETYYSRLEEDFNFDNESLRDYARKVCKASLASDKAQADFAAGKISYSDVKDAMNIFDMLSKSANFAACRRKTGEASGLTCWAETTFKLESSGTPIESKVEFEKDDIDKTIEELKHIVKALGLDSI